MSGWPTCHPLKRSWKRLGWLRPDLPATGSTAAAPSACVSVYQCRRSATPCSHSSETGTPTRAEPRNNPYKPSVRSHTENQPPPTAQPSSGGLLPLASSTPEHFRRTGPDRPQTQRDDQLGPFAVDANYQHKYLRSTGHASLPSSRQQLRSDPASPKGSSRRLILRYWRLASPGMSAGLGLHFFPAASPKSGPHLRRS
jgi:hypothetical protein